MHGHAVGRCPHQHVANLLSRGEIAGRIDADVLRLGLDDAAGRGHVAGAHDVLDLRGLQIERRQTVGRVIEVELLLEHTVALHFCDDGNPLQRPLDQIGEIVELPVRITVARQFGDAVPGRLRIANDDRAPRVRMEVIHLEPRADEVVDVGPQLLVGPAGREVDACAAADGDRPHVARDAVAPRLVRKHARRSFDHSRRDRPRVAVERAHASGRIPAARRFDRLAHAAGTQLDLLRRYRRARHRQHQRRGVAEIADPRDRARSIRQVVNGGEPLSDVLEFLVGVLDAVQEPDLHDRDIVLGGRLDALDLVVAGCRLLDLSSDQLLDLVGGDTRPRADGQADPHRNVGILPLRHVHVAEGAPGHGGEQRHPGNLAVDREISRMFQPLCSSVLTVPPPRAVRLSAGSRRS